MSITKVVKVKRYFQNNTRMNNYEKIKIFQQFLTSEAKNRKSSLRFFSFSKSFNKAKKYFVMLMKIFNTIYFIILV